MYVELGSNDGSSVRPFDPTPSNGAEGSARDCRPVEGLGPFPASSSRPAMHCRMTELAEKRRWKMARMSAPDQEFSSERRDYERILFVRRRDLRSYAPSRANRSLPLRYVSKGPRICFHNNCTSRSARFSMDHRKRCRWSIRVHAREGPAFLYEVRHSFNRGVGRAATSDSACCDIGRRS